MAQTSQAALQGDTTAQQVMPKVGRAIGDIWGPIGGMAGSQIGDMVGNLFATGDAAGAATGSQASNETNLGGLFQGRGVSGFWNNFLEPQLLGGPGKGQGGGSKGLPAAYMGGQVHGSYLDPYQGQSSGGGGILSGLAGNYLSTLF